VKKKEKEKKIGNSVLRISLFRPDVKKKEKKKKRKRGNSVLRISLLCPVEENKKN